MKEYCFHDREFPVCYNDKVLVPLRVLSPCFSKTNNVPGHSRVNTECWHFQWWTAVGIDTLTDLQLSSPIHNTLCNVTQFYENHHFLLTVWPVTLGCPGTCHGSFLWPLLINTDHCRLGTPTSSVFGDALTQPGCHHSLVQMLHCCPVQFITLEKLHWG